jgi:hypothetical protein
MIRLTLPLLLLSTILCASLQAETAPAKSFRFAPKGNIKAGAYDVKIETKYAILGSVSGWKGLAYRFRADMMRLAEYTVTVVPANKKQEQVLELTYERLQESTSNSVTKAKEAPKKKGESFDSHHPKQAKGMECIEKRMSVMGKKARWTLCKGALVKRDGFEQLRHKADDVAKIKPGAYQDAASVNLLIDRGEALFPQYTRSLLPVKPAKVGDTWERKVDIASWLRPSSGDLSIPAKATCTLSKVKGTVATVTFSLEIPPCSYTGYGMHTTTIGKERGSGSLQYDLATQMITTEQISFTLEMVQHEKGAGPRSGPSTTPFQQTLTITPKKAKAKAKAAPAKKPAN